MNRNNIAARMGRWSATHWKTATFGWLAFVVVSFGIGGMVGMKTLDADAPGPGESGRMDRILDAGFPQPAGESILVQSSTLRTTDPEFRAAVHDVVAAISKLDAVQHVRSPLAPANSGQIAPNGHAALVGLQIRGDPDTAVDRIGPVLDRVDELQQAHPQLFIGQFGDASKVDALVTAYGDDLGKAGLLSLPVTLVILLVAFGTLVAAGIPLLLALTAVFATFGLVAIPSHVFPVAMQAPALVLLIGLAVGVDYSMFYLKREREERAAGRSEQAALEAAAATSGRSVLVAGLTVIVAMAGMFLTGDSTFESLGVAAITVVAIAVLGSLTVLPALLSRLGDKVDRGRVPFVGRRRAGGESRFWGAIVDRVLRRPLLSVLLAGGLLVALAVPALQLRMAMAGPDTFPRSLPVVQAYTKMQQSFPGKALPANVVVTAPNVKAPAVQDAIRRLERQALASGRMHQPITVDVNPDRTLARVSIPLVGDGTNTASEHALQTLRGSVVPKTVGAVATAYVAGPTAASVDFNHQLSARAPYVFGFVLALAFLLLMWNFRSIVIPATAIAMNLLSVGAAYGVLVSVFQGGWGIVHVNGVHHGPIAAWLPLFLFVILFGLSMDYHVFILSRIRENHARGLSTREAIRTGITHSAGVITSAERAWVSGSVALRPVITPALLMSLASTITPE